MARLKSNFQIHISRRFPSTAERLLKTAAWPECASELYRPSDRHLSAKLVPTFTDRGCHVVSVTSLTTVISGF
jgi:hypothetical protein